MWKKLIDISKKVITPVDIKGWISNILIAIPRIIGGLLLTIDFGASKFGMPWTDSEKNLSLFQVASWFPEDVAKFGIPFSIAPVFFAWMAAASEAIGGLFLVLGLKTRVAAFLIGCTMLVAIFFQKSGEGIWNMLPARDFSGLVFIQLCLVQVKLVWIICFQKKYLTNSWSIEKCNSHFSSSTLRKTSRAFKGPNCLFSRREPVLYPK